MAVIHRFCVTLQTLCHRGVQMARKQGRRLSCREVIVGEKTARSCVSEKGIMLKWLQDQVGIGAAKSWAQIIEEQEK